MKETMCMMLAIFAGLGVVMLAGALIEGGLSALLLLGLAACALAARGFYRLGTQPVRRARRVRRHTSPAVGFSKKSGSLRAA
ncbi:hypothetical protein [Allofournierella sp.]|uniref:hypothetical protein n=1 Tax=Allofournierella sp. TaxID=1940256 RepID=UPI002E7AACF2|nr:hypothetical protein [Fournierella sp.]MEE0757000.1 hypothetical protein [Fournierella sp.]